MYWNAYLGANYLNSVWLFKIVEFCAQIVKCRVQMVQYSPGKSNVKIFPGPTVSHLRFAYTVCSLWCELSTGSIVWWTGLSVPCVLYFTHPTAHALQSADPWPACHIDGLCYREVVISYGCFFFFYWWTFIENNSYKDNLINHHYGIFSLFSTHNFKNRQPSILTDPSGGMSLTGFLFEGLKMCLFWSEPWWSEDNIICFFFCVYGRSWDWLLVASV